MLFGEFVWREDFITRFGGDIKNNNSSKYELLKKCLFSIFQ